MIYYPMRLAKSHILLHASIDLLINHEQRHREVTAVEEESQGAVFQTWSPCSATLGLHVCVPSPLLVLFVLVAHSHDSEGAAGDLLIEKKHEGGGEHRLQQLSFEAFKQTQQTRLLDSVDQQTFDGPQTGQQLRPFFGLTELTKPQDGLNGLKWICDCC